MKKSIWAIALSVMFILLVSCNDPGGSEPTFHIEIQSENALGNEGLTMNSSMAISGEEIILTARLEDARRVSLSSPGIIFSSANISMDGDSTSFIMPSEDVQINAVFSDIPPEAFTISILSNSAESDEKITADLSEAGAGETITLTASLGSHRQVYLSAPGIVIDPSILTVDGSSASFTMPVGNVSVSAEFSDTKYNVVLRSAGTSSGEEVSANLSKAAPGETITLTASLGSHRQVHLSAPGIIIAPSVLTVDGSSASFTMPGADANVSADFSDTKYNVVLQSVGTLSGEDLSADLSQAALGETITLTASLGNRREVSLSAPGVIITPSVLTSDGETASCTMVGSDVYISAEFRDTPVEVAFRGTAETCPGGTNQSYQINLGNESTDRIVVVCVSGWRNTSRTVNGVTVNGITLTKHGQDSSADQPNSIWSGLVPTGTVVPITINWNGDNSAVGCSVYSVYNASSVVPSVNLNGSTSTYNVNAEAGTGIIGFFSATEPYSTFTWSGSMGIIKDVELDYSSCYGSNRVVMSTASCTMTNGSATVSAEGSQNNRYLYIIGFK